MIGIANLPSFAVGAPLVNWAFLWLRPAFSIRVKPVAAIVILTP